MKINITIELSDEELRVLREIDTYCRDGADINRAIRVQKLYDQFKVSGFTISTLLSNQLIYSRSIDYPYHESGGGDELRKFEVCVTTIGIKVVKATNKQKVTRP